MKHNVVFFIFFLFISFFVFYASAREKGKLPDERILSMEKILIEKGKLSPNYGKTVGVFGGSLSSLPQSEKAKDVWRKYLGMRVTTYGISGYGFSSQQGSIQNQVDHAAPKDIYILWASTNDYNGQRICGSPYDYSVKDAFNKEKLTTQCGGINYCIKKLREINPSAKIYLFTSLPFFSDESGYDRHSKKTNKTGYNFAYYVKMQKRCCRVNGIPYLDQFSSGFFDKNNSAVYYMKDRLHLNEEGNALIGIYQAFFLSELK